MWVLLTLAWYRVMPLVMAVDRIEKLRNIVVNSPQQLWWPHGWTLRLPSRMWFLAGLRKL